MCGRPGLCALCEFLGNSAGGRDAANTQNTVLQEHDHDVMGKRRIGRFYQRP